MQRKSFADMACPIARTLEHVGEWWSLLILRDAFAGKTRFDEFQRSLGIAPNMLARRLAALVEAGLLERRRYSERPPRDEYRLSDRGRDFRTVMLALLDFGHRHYGIGPEGTRIVDAKTGRLAQAVLVDRHTGRPLNGPAFAVVRGRAGLHATSSPAGAAAGPRPSSPATSDLDAAPPPAARKRSATPTARRRRTAS